MGQYSLPNYSGLDFGKMFCQSIVYFMIDLFIFLKGNLFKKSENVYVTVCGGEQQLEIKALAKK